MLWSYNPSGFFFIEFDNFRIKSESSISDLAKRFKISSQVRVVNCFYPISYRSVKSIVAVFVDVVGHEGLGTFCAGCSVVAGMNLPCFS